MAARAQAPLQIYDALQNTHSAKGTKTKILFCSHIFSRAHTRRARIRRLVRSAWSRGERYIPAAWFLWCGWRPRTASN